MLTNIAPRQLAALHRYFSAIMVSSGHHHFYVGLDLMPNISMIEKVVQQICAIDYLVSKYTILLINQFVQRQNFLIDEDISRRGLLSSSKECTH